MRNVDLYYLSPNPYGGWVTFTAHLMSAFRASGVTPKLFKVGNNTEKKTRPYGYGEVYQNISLGDAKKRALSEPSLIVAAAKNFKEATETLLDFDAFLVVHDPTELKNLPANLPQERVIVPRRVGLTAAPRAHWIRHPYERMGEDDDGAHPRPVRAVSTSRIDFDKHTTVILDANRLVDEAHKVQIRGFENRLYTRFKVVPHYPEWEQSKAHYPRDRDAAFHLLASAQLSVDMSIIKGDGGGTQYTTLEAWDAGTVPVLQKAWLMDGDDMEYMTNCLAVADAENLAYTLTNEYLPLKQLREAGYESLKSHNPELIGEQYAEVMRL